MSTHFDPSTSSEIVRTLSDRAYLPRGGRTITILRIGDFAGRERYAAPATS